MNLDQTSLALERFNAVVELTRTNLESLNSRFTQGGSFESLTNMRRQQEHIGEITTVIARNFSKAGEDFEASLTRSLGIAARIVRVLNSLGNPRSTPAAGFFGLFGTVLSLFGSFEEGGYTGNLPAAMPAGVVHGGEMVFEKNIVDNNLAGLLHLRSALQAGGSLGSLFGGLSDSAIAPLIAEIRQLRKEQAQLRETPIQPHISIGQVFDTQRFFIDGDVQLQQYKKNKIV